MVSGFGSLKFFICSVNRNNENKESTKCSDDVSVVYNEQIRVYCHPLRPSRISYHSVVKPVYNDHPKD